MVDLWGPDAFGAGQAASVRPSYVPTNGAGDPETWAQDCSSPAADDGTEWRSALLNILLAQLRGVPRKSGVAVSNLDDLLLARAIRSQGLNFIPTIGGTANALTATLDPAPADWVALTGTPFRFVVSTANTAAATLNLNGLGAKDIVYPGDNSALLAGELRAGAVRTGLYDGTNVQLIDVGSRARAGVAFRGVTAFFANGTFDPSPLGLSVQDRILVLCWGGGGGGASTISSGGAGGGAGGLAIRSMDCPASPVSITIGAGGAGNSAGSNGAAGGTTSFGPHCSATGGGGATGGAGVGGGGVGGTLNLPGGYGCDLLAGPDWAAGGSAPFMGPGLINNGGNNPIGAGGGTDSVNAYAGAPGAVIVFY